MKKILISFISILCISNTYSQTKELDTLGFRVITGNNTISLKASSDNTYPDYKFNIRMKRKITKMQEIEGVRSN